MGTENALLGTTSDNTINGKEFRGSNGLWGLMPRKNVDENKITTHDLKKYKRILELTNVRLTD